MVKTQYRTQKNYYIPNHINHCASIVAIVDVVRCWCLSSSYYLVFIEIIIIAIREIVSSYERNLYDVIM